MIEQNQFSRTELLIGKEAINKLKKAKVVVFGIGGVGSYAVEALVRAGVGKLILVDNDVISITNINRQIHANVKTINLSKVQVMKDRIMDINTECNVKTYQTFVKEDNIETIIDEDTDYVVDAIDTVTSKIALALWCNERNIKIISSMGTGNKLDPTKFKIGDIYKTTMCPLAKVMRKELRKRGLPSFKVLYSEEAPIKQQEEQSEMLELEKAATLKRQVPGSISFVPPVAGMIIAGEVIKDLIGISERK